MTNSIDTNGKLIIVPEQSLHCSRGLEKNSPKNIKDMQAKTQPLNMRNLAPKIIQTDQQPRRKIAIPIVHQDD